MEGRDLSSRQTQDVARDQEIGKPINSFYALYNKMRSYAAKLVTVLGKGGGVSVTVRADHTSI